MHHLRFAVPALLALASAASAQRTVNTGGPQASQRAFEVGVDVASLAVGLEKPKYLNLSLGGQPLVRLAWFMSNNMAFEPRFSWFSSARENAVGFTSYTVDFGVLYGLSTMAPTDKPWYVRPGVMISGGSGGSRSYTTLSGAFGMRRMMHGVIMHNEIALNRQLESGPVAAETYIQLRHGISIRRK